MRKRPRLGIAAAAVVVIAAPAALAFNAFGTGRRASGSATKLTISATPSGQTIAASEVARYRIAIRRGRNLLGSVKLAVDGGLPAGARASFAPAATGGSSSVLSIATRAHTASGRYRPHLKATRGGITSTTSITLAVSSLAAGFAIGGSVGDLHPGSPAAVNLTLTNPTPGLLLIHSLTVSIQRLDAPNATRTLPCTASDFSIQQYSNLVPLSIPGSSTRTLAQLRIPSVEWPKVTLVDSSANQDGCQGASLTLMYSGNGSFT